MTRLRVTAAATVAALLVAVLGSLLFVHTLSQNLETSLRGSADTEISRIAAQLEQGETPGAAVVSGKDDIITQVVGTDGVLLGTDHPSVITPLRTTTGTTERLHIDGLADHYLVVARRVSDGRLVIVGRSDEQVGKATETVGGLLAVSVPVGLALLALAVWLSVGRALRPVEAMRRRAATITSAHLAQRLPIPAGGDEIHALALTLNGMLDRIDASHQLQRQFVSDASHELRSPLAALRQLAEVAAHYPERTELEPFAQDVLAEERRMEDMVNALLLLARPDPTRGDTVIDLDDVVLAEVQRASSDRVQVRIVTVCAAQVRGDTVLWSQVVRNLVSNAVRHADHVVEVGMSTQGSHVSLTVDDDGAGIDLADRERVFERFVRLDEARDRDHGGSGLGLSIVRKIVTAYGGTAVVADSPLGGARFVVTVATTG